MRDGFSSEMLIILKSFLKQHGFLLAWISLVSYLFYNTFIHYQNGEQFRRLRNILGLGLCISRSTASVLNLCSALILLPLCKKLNQVVYRVLSEVWPSVFFMWLEKAKSFHITVAVTLILFAVIHSISHFVNLWSFSRNYDVVFAEINVANYKDENPMRLLLNQPGVSGVCMLLICLLMGITSSRIIRRNHYNVFWYTHELYLVFLLLLLIHPLSGVLKEEVLELDTINGEDNIKIDKYSKTFVAVKSTTWLWMALPLTCFFTDLIWRRFSRNRERLQILDKSLMAGRMIRLVLSCPEDLRCRIGQYVLLQCPDISVIEWHPFTVVQIPTIKEKYLTVWIRVNGDWTEALEEKLLDPKCNIVSVLMDGPFCSPMESTMSSDVCICIGAGVGITPFVALLRALHDYPCSRLPKRVHLIWIVRHEHEISWLADLANKTLLRLRHANKPDRLNIELYVTEAKNSKNIIVVDGPSAKTILIDRNFEENESSALIAPNLGNCKLDQVKYKDSYSYKVAEIYPVLGCRLRRGRPYWDRVFGYWVHLYPDYNLKLYCCGPKKLTLLLRRKCKLISQSTNTNFTFVHEGFS